MKKLLAICVVVSLLVVAHPVLAEYYVIDIGTFCTDPQGYWDQSRAYAINETGQVVGWADRIRPNYEYPFLWQDGLLSSLSGVVGMVGVAYNVNNSGYVVGFDSSGAFIWRNEVKDSLGMLQGHWTSHARGINDANQVVGDSVSHQAAQHAVIWHDGQITDMGKLFGGWQKAQARSIDDAGKVVGWSFVSPWPSDDRHAFLVTPDGNDWYRDNDGNGINDLMTDLGTLGGDSSAAFAINDFNQVVGWAQYPESNERACLWNLGVELIDLGTLGGSSSQALGINNLGHVVGYSTTVSGESHAFLWKNGSMIDLNDQIHPESGWLLKEARDINNDEWIVGYGTNPYGEEHAFLLVQEPICAPKPEADLNDSCKVNFDDFAIFAKAWRSQPGDSNWNQACDISDPNDNVINMHDLVVVAECWLECNLLPPEVCWE